jgi:hypothetical protein
MCSIKPHAIFNPYTCIYNPTCSTLTLILKIQRRKDYFKRDFNVALRNGKPSFFPIAIEKLDKINFQMWKLKIMNFLRGKDYWKLMMNKNLFLKKNSHHNKFKPIYLGMKELGKSWVGFYDYPIP